jgi:hypothetical protein
MTAKIFSAQLPEFFGLVVKRNLPEVDGLDLPAKPQMWL